MPDVPQYGGLRVGPDPVRAQPLAREHSLSDFGSGGEEAQTRRAIGGLGAEVQRIAKEELDYGMEVAVQDQVAAFSGESLRLKEQVESVKGIDATKAADKALEDFDKFYAKRSEGIGNPIVKRATQQQYQRYRDRLNSSVVPYANSEVRRFDDQRFGALIKNSQAAITQDPMNQEAVGGAIYDQQQAIKAYAKRNGLPEEAHTQLYASALSHSNYLAIEAMASQGHNGAAREYHKEHGNTLIGDEAIRARKIVEEGTTREEAYKNADSIMGKGVPLQQALEEVRKIEDTDVRAATNQLVKQMYGEDEAAKEATQKGIYEKAYKAWEANPNIHPRESIPANEWALLDSNYKAAIERTYANSKRPEDQQTNWEMSGKLFTISQKDLQKMTLADVYSKARPYLSNAKYDEFFKKWQDASDPVKTQKFQSDFTRDQMYMRTLASARIGGFVQADAINPTATAKDNGEKAALFGAFKNAVDIERMNFHETKKRDPDDKETNAIANGIAMRWGQELSSEDEYYSTFPSLSIERRNAQRKRKLYEYVQEPTLIDRQLFHIEPEVMSEFYKTAKHIPGLVPASMDENAFIRQHKNQLRLAYIAFKNGASGEVVANILASK
jgi:hypothetical protein